MALPFRFIIFHFSFVQFLYIHRELRFLPHAHASAKEPHRPDLKMFRLFQKQPEQNTHLFNRFLVPGPIDFITDVE